MYKIRFLQICLQIVVDLDAHKLNMKRGHSENFRKIENL